MKTRTVVLEIEVESGVVDPVLLHRVSRAVERNGGSDTDRWIVRRIEVRDS